MSGKVVDEVTKAPVSGAVIGLYPVMRNGPTPTPGVGQMDAPLASTETLANGAFILRAPGPGAYWLSIRTEGNATDYDPYGEPVMLTARELPLSLALQPRPPLRLKLLTPDGRPAAGPVKVWEWLLWGERQTAMRVVTQTLSPDGTLVTPAPPRIPLPKVSKALVELRSESGLCGQLRLNGWPDGVQLVQMEKGVTLTGSVVDDGGKPVPNARVMVYRTLGATGMPAAGGIELKTSLTGQFEAPGLLAGGYFVQVQIPGVSQPFYRSVSLNGDRTNLELKPDPGPGEPSLWDETLPAIEKFPVPYASLAPVVDPDATRTLLPISGRVVDGMTRAAVAGAIVFLDTAPDGEKVDTVMTGADGAFTLRAALPGAYSLGVEVGNYGYAVQELKLPAATNAPLEITTKSPPVIKTRLVRGDGKPVPPGPVDLHTLVGTEVAVREPGWSTGQVGADGTAEFRSTRGSPFSETETQLLVTAISPTAGVGQVRLDHWKGEQVTVPMRPGWKLNGRVLDAAGLPLSRVVVVLSQWLRGDVAFRRTLQFITNTRCDNQGNFQFTFIPGSTCFVQWTVPGEPTHAAVVTFAHPETSVILIPLHPTAAPEGVLRSSTWLESILEPLQPPPGSEPYVQGPSIPVSGKVVGQPDSQPLQNALVLLFEADWTAPTAMTRSAADGSFKVNAPSAGAFRIAVAWKGYLAEQIPIDIQPGGVNQVDLHAPSEPALRLSLLDLNGKPASGQAQLWVKGNGVSEPLDGPMLTAPITSTGFVSFQPPYAGPLLAVTDFQLWLRVEGVGYAQLALDHWPTDVMSIRLHAGSSLEGDVVDGVNKALPDVIVTATRMQVGLYAAFLQEKFQTLTDSAGRFTFRNLFPGVYRIEALPNQMGSRSFHQDGFTPWSRTLLLPQVGKVKLVLAVG